VLMQDEAEVSSTWHPELCSAAQFDENKAIVCDTIFVLPQVYGRVKKMRGTSITRERKT
jgi:hypothetical protein